MASQGRTPVYTPAPVSYPGSSSAVWTSFQNEAESPTPGTVGGPSVDLSFESTPSFGSSAAFSPIPHPVAATATSNANWVSFDSPRDFSYSFDSATTNHAPQVADFASFNSQDFHTVSSPSSSVPVRHDSEPPSYSEVSQAYNRPVLQHSLGRRLDSEDPSDKLQTPNSGSATWSPWNLPKEPADSQKYVRRYSTLSTKDVLDTHSFKDMMRRAWLSTPPAFCNLRLPPIRGGQNTTGVNCMAIMGNELFVGVAKVCWLGLYNKGEDLLCSC